VRGFAQVDRVLGLAGQVRRSIPNRAGTTGTESGSFGLSQSSLDALCFRFLSSLARSSRAGVSMPDFIQIVLADGEGIRMLPTDQTGGIIRRCRRG